MKALEQAQEWLDYWLSEGADSEILGWKIDEQIAELARNIGTFPDETDTALGVRIPALVIYLKAKQQLREHLIKATIEEAGQ